MNTTANIATPAAGAAAGAPTPAATPVAAIRIAAASDTGKALVTALGDSSRTVLPLDQIAAKVAALTAIPGHSLPLIYAGGSESSAYGEAAAAEGAEQAMVGFVGQKRKESGATAAETYFCAIVVAPMFGLEAILAHESGSDWVAKVIEKEMAHVAFRPIRNVEDGEDYATYATSVPATVEAFVTQSSRAKIDTSALGILWPTMRDMLVAKQPGLAAFLPGKGKQAIADVSKAMRSADWARRNSEQLESRGIWAQFIMPAIIQLGSSPVKLADGTEMVLNVAPIESWLATRDEVKIDPVFAREGADESVLDDFLSMFGGDEDGEGDGE